MNKQDIIFGLIFGFITVIISNLFDIDYFPLLLYGILVSLLSTLQEMIKED